MDFKRWDEQLVAEHELIERAMAVLKVELEKARTGAPDTFRFSRAVDFLLEFGDRIHNRKEEDSLFPLMEERGIPKMGPIRVMLIEHQAERDLLRNMQAVVGGLGTLTPQEREKLVADGMDYLQVRSEHIWKENDILYAMGRQVMDDEDNRSLLEAFSKIDLETYGAGAFERYAQMVAEIEAGSGAKRPLIENLTPEQIHGIFEALPVEVTFVDANDQVLYFNRLDREKIFVRTRSVIGRKVQKCHPEKSVGVVNRIIQAFREGRKDKAVFWIDFHGDKVMISYYPVRNDKGEYLGVLEVTQRIGEIQQLTGERRLLEWED